MKELAFTFSLLMALTLAPWVPVHAQLGAGSEPLSLEVRPQFPEPNSDVEVRVRPFGFDLDSATVSWYVDGTLVNRGVGVRSINLETGPLGSRTRVEVVAGEPDGRTARASATLQPNEVVLVWEANTYTPPLYKGRALQTPDAAVTVVAYPELAAAGGARISPDNLIYTWERGGSVLNDRSGYGKRRIEVTNPSKLSAMEVRVSVSSVNGSVRGAGAILIPMNEPVVRVYEQHPLLGMRFERALFDAVTADEQELTLRAYPYFFSAASPDDAALQYSWRADGETVDANGRPGTVTVRRDEEGSDEQTVSVGLQHMERLLQSARGQFRVLFGDGNE